MPIKTAIHQHVWSCCTSPKKGATKSYAGASNFFNRLEKVVCTTTSATNISVEPYVEFLRQFGCNLNRFHQCLQTWILIITSFHSLTPLMCD